MLKLFNTSGKKIMKFSAADNGLVTVFTCGPSVYQRAHIGNFRTFLFEDILVRYLEYSGYRVVRGMTVTDVEDKAIAEAARANTTLKRLTDSNIAKFLDEMKLLGIRIPDHLPRASECVDEAVAIIEKLLARKIAYRHGGNIYFDPLKFPGFGKLYGLDMSDWPSQKRRFHLDTYPGMRWNLGDFILWHGFREGEQTFWDTRIGRGRPSWNVQDPSMISRYFSRTLSVYCGGIDNLIRHHDYTKAVLESIRPYPAAKFWLHCSHLFVNGRKMSKSIGNIHYTDTLMRNGYTAAEVRFFLIYGHYRRKLNYSGKAMDAAVGRLREFRRRVAGIEKRAGAELPIATEAAGILKKSFNEKMDNDLDVKGAFDALDRLLAAAADEYLEPAKAAAAVASIREIDSVLKVIF